jgi:hypothetical protein
MNQKPYSEQAQSIFDRLKTISKVTKRLQKQMLHTDTYWQLDTAISSLRSALRAIDEAKIGLAGREKANEGYLKTTKGKFGKYTNIILPNPNTTNQE